MNLERLDLSVNNISNLAPLASLRHLSVLNLSSNKISNLGEFFLNDLFSLFLYSVSAICSVRFFPHVMVFFCHLKSLCALVRTYRT